MKQRTKIYRKTICYILIIFTYMSCGLPSNPKIYPPAAVERKTNKAEFLNQPDERSLTGIQSHDSSFSGYDIYYRIVYKNTDINYNVPSNKRISLPTGTTMYDYLTTSNNDTINYHFSKAIDVSEIKSGTAPEAYVSAFRLKKLYLAKNITPPLEMGYGNSINFVDNTGVQFDPYLKISFDFSQLDIAPYLPEVGFNNKKYNLVRYFKINEKQVVESFNPLGGNFYKNDPDVIDPSYTINKTAPLDTKIMFFVATKGFDLPSGSGILYSELTYLGHTQLTITLNINDDRKF